MSARCTKPRRCVCAAPIPYRDPGEPAACAKCGHRLAVQAAETAAVVVAAAAGSTAVTAYRGGQRQVSGVSRDGPERVATELGLTTPPTGTPFEWPFAPPATLRQADRPLEGAG